MSLVRCLTCKGLGHVNGMGGILRDCKVCDGVGKIKKVEPVDISVEPVDETPEIVQMAQASTDEIVEAIASSRIDEESKKQTLPKKKEPEVVETLDELTQAALDEPKMTTEQWRTKYPKIAEITDTRQRHEARVLYASRKAPAPRKVNLGAMQDDVALKDSDYLAYEAKENARLEREEAKKGASKK